MDSKQISPATQVKKSIIDGIYDISLTRILNTEKCQMILNGCRDYRDRIYTPTKTIFIFIKQVLNPDKSCKAAVAGALAEELNVCEKQISANTGAFCKARQRLPEEAIYELVKETGGMSSELAPEKWKTYGRNLRVFDGSTVKMSDTTSNQITYPQDTNQKKGCGFPIMRFLIILCLATGTVLDYAVSACKGKGTGECSLLKRIFNTIKKDDIVLGDRNFPNYYLLSNLQMRGADGIFRGQGQRKYDFRSGKLLGKKDHIAEWKRPVKPKEMSDEEYESYPDRIKVREFEVSGNVYVTTLLDHKKYDKRELAKIYKRRWDVEINLKSIKSTMDMDMLTCKSPEMVRKEIGAHFLAYNVIRIIMAESCIKQGTEPWKISFKGAVQLINTFMPHFLTSTQEKNRIMYERMLYLIAKNVVGNRPGRVEPRKKKRRPKQFPLLDKPRAVEKIRLMKNINKKVLKYATA